MKCLSFFYGASLILLLFSCSKSKTAPGGTVPTPAPASAISISPSILTIGSNAGDTSSVTIQSSINWKLIVSPANAATWLKLNVTEGMPGTSKVILSVIDSNSGASQTATVTASASNDNNVLSSLTVIQRAHATDTKNIYTINHLNLYGGYSIDQAFGIIKTVAAGEVIAGATGSNDGDVTGFHGGTNDAWLINLDSDNNIIWQKCFGGSGDDYALAITAAPDGGFVFAGASNSNNADVSGNHGGYDFWAVKLDANGNKIWQRSLGGSGDDIAYAITATSDGGFVLAGTSNSHDGDVSGNHGGTDFWVVKLDANGNKIWNKFIVGGGQPLGITNTPDGGLAVAANTSSIIIDGDIIGNHGGEDILVVKLDANGNKLWQKCFGGSRDEQAEDIYTANGELFVAGSTTSTDGDVTGGPSGGKEAAWVLKLDAVGNILWQKTVGGLNTYNNARAATPTSDGGIMGVGSQSVNNLADAWAFKLDANGNIIWERTIGGTYWDEALAITTTTDEKIAIAGYTESKDGDMIGNHGLGDYWVMILK